MSFFQGAELNWLVRILGCCGGTQPMSPAYCSAYCRSLWDTQFIDLNQQAPMKLQVDLSNFLSPKFCMEHCGLISGNKMFWEVDMTTDPSMWI